MLLSTDCNFTGSLTLLHGYFLSESWMCIRRKEEREYQSSSHALYHFILFILLSQLNGKFNWHGTNGAGPVNVSIVEIMTPVWNVSWTGRVNPCFVWGCAWDFRRTILPSRLCLNHLVLNVMCGECDSYPWQLRPAEDLRVNPYYIRKKDTNTVLYMYSSTIEITQT